MKFLSFCLLFIVVLSNALAQSANHIIDYKTLISLENNRLVKEKSFLIQINDNKAEWITEIEIPYKEDNPPDILYAEIIDSNGNVIRKLKKKEIETKSSISSIAFHEDHFVKKFSLKHDIYPYRIRYSYREVSQQFIYVTRWTPYIYTNIHTQKASLIVDLPKDYKVAIKESEGINYTIDTLKDSFKYQWHVEDQLPINEEIFAPPIIEEIPLVKIVPIQFNYGIIGRFESWASFGKWQEDLNLGLDELPGNDKIKLNYLIKGLSDKKEIIKTLYKYLQDNSRYIYVGIDIGGLKPYPASYVSKNKYGDCKALTIYMKALLKYAGIPSYYTTIYAGDNPIKIDKDFPSQQFNHVILCVPLEKDTIWLENTANYLPYNYLGTFTQNRYGLLVNGSKSALVKTPGLKFADVEDESSYNFILSEDGSGTVSVSHRLRGENFEQFRNVKYNYNETIQKKLLSEINEIKNFSITDFDIIDERDSMFIDVQMQLKVDSQIRKLAEMLIIKPVPLKLIDTEKPEVRKSSLRINYPVNKIDTISYTLPDLDDYEVELPENITINSKYGRLDVQYSKNENTLSIIRKYQLFSQELDKEEYSNWYSFIQEIKKYQNSSAFILNPI